MIAFRLIGIVVLMLTASCSPSKPVTAKTVETTSEWKKGPETSTREYVGVAESGEPVRMLLSIRSLPPSQLTSTETYWGAGGEPLQRELVTIISAMSVQVGGKPIRIFRSAYSDLTDMHLTPISGVRISPSPGGFKIEIKGGDAAGSYDAVLGFIDEGLVSRRVVDGEFPDNIYEEAKYRFDTTEAQ